MSIICLSGKMQSGKDTFSDVLTKKHGYKRIALADPLRELCAHVFHMDYDLFLAPEKKDAAIPDGRVTLDFHHIDRIRRYVETVWGYDIDEEAREGMEAYHGVVEFDTPRDILRHVGTRLLRENVSDQIWLELAMAQIRDAGGKVIVTDCRFENERELFRKCGALLILIKRHDDGNPKEHEFSLGSEDEYDVVFDNSGTLTEYQSNVDMWYTLRKNELELYKVFKYD